MTLVREKSSYDFSLFIHDVKLVVRNGLTAGIFVVCGFRLVKLSGSKIYMRLADRISSRPVARQRKKILRLAQFNVF